MYRNAAFRFALNFRANICEQKYKINVYHELVCRNVPVGCENVELRLRTSSKLNLFLDQHLSAQSQVRFVNHFFTSIPRLVEIRSRNEMMPSDEART